MVVGALLRLLFYHFRPAVVGDALMYSDLAQNMVAHHVYGISSTVSGVSVTVIQPTLIRLPGYPLFLAACYAVFGGGLYTAAIWLQMALDLAGCALLGLLAEKLAGRRAGLAAVWLAALCPFTSNYSVVVLAETLSVLCVVVALLALERWVTLERAWGWVVVLGCALAGAVLLRPDEGILAAAILPVMGWVGVRRRSWGPVAVASLLVVLPLSIWTARNWRVFRVIQPLAPRYANDPGETVPYGFQRWFRTWAVDYTATVDVYWNYDAAPVRVEDLPARAFDDAEQNEKTVALLGRYNQVVSATPAFDAAFGQIAAKRIADHPLRYYLVLPVGREINMWLRPRVELTALPMDWWAVRAHPVASAEEIAYALLNAAYLGLGVVGIVIWRRRGFGGRGAVAWAMLGFVALRCALLLTLDNSEPRYTLECFPVVIVLAAVALGSRTMASD
jgi:4-amino-4-deoxy-L-arabinose transferase-like glycosyltransferase